MSADKSRSRARPRYRQKTVRNPVGQPACIGVRGLDRDLVGCRRRSSTWRPICCRRRRMCCPASTASRVSLWNHSLVTLQEIIMGFGLSVVTAIPAGLLIALSPTAKRMLYPFLMFIQLVPKIAIAPLFVVWVGFGMTSKVLLTLLLTFFPLLLASIAGFQILDQRLLYLTRSLGATFWQTFRYLRFPAALPVIFGGLKTSATIAATAAIVAEFVGANKGLGYILLQATGTLDTTYVFAILFLLTIIGLALNSHRRSGRILHDALAPRRKSRKTAEIQQTPQEEKMLEKKIRTQHKFAAIATVASPRLRRLPRLRALPIPPRSLFSSTTRLPATMPATSSRLRRASTRMPGSTSPSSPATARRSPRNWSRPARPTSPLPTPRR